MNETLSCFICFAAGIALNATYHRIRIISEKKAYRQGYKQAKKEASKVKEKDSFNEDAPLHIEARPSYQKPQPKREIFRLDESFMNELHNNGCAVIKFPKNGDVNNR